MADYDRIHELANEAAQATHGNDARRFSRGGRSHDDSYLHTSHAPPVASDAPASDGYFGHDSEQEFVDHFRASQDDRHVPLDRGHVQDRRARADDYGRTTDAHSSYRRR